MSLTREQVLAYAMPTRLRRQEVSIPGWDGSVWVREFTQGEYVAFLRGLRVDEVTGRVNDPEYGEKLAAICLCTEEGERLFADGDVAALATLPASALAVIVDAAQKLNGLTAPVADEVKN